MATRKENIIDFNQAVRKKQKKRRRKNNRATLRFWGAVLAFVIIIAVFALSVTVLFPIQKVTVRGETVYSQNQILKVSGIHKGENLFMSGRNAAKIIPQRMPYIASVKIIRNLNGNVVLEVRPNTVSFVYVVKDKYYYADAKNKLLEIKSEPAATGTVINGLTFKNNKIGQTLSFTDKNSEKLVDTIINTLNDAKITCDSIDISNPVNLAAKVDNRLEINFGSSVNLAEKIGHLKAMYEKMEPTATGTVDLSSWTPENPEAILKRK